MSTDKNPVLFYGHSNGVFGGFSNFFPSEFKFQGHSYACSEQAYMAGKSTDPDYLRLVRNTQDPYKVKKLGRAVKLRDDWDTIKYPWMVLVLKAKFSQNTQLKELLLCTGDRPIHEDCADPWWGGGPNHPDGKDLLGKALTEVRAWLRTNEDAVYDGMQNV